MGQDVLTCRYETYGKRCKEPWLNQEGYCKEHSEAICNNCGLHSDIGCDYCGQFVCGAPACKQCGACSVDHGASKSRKKPTLRKSELNLLSKEQLIKLVENQEKLLFDMELEKFNKK